jgi:hypothetical protein
MDRIFTITGGVYFGSARSASLMVLNCENIQDGYETVRHWAKNQFPDWNNISTNYTIENPLITIGCHKPVRYHVAWKR